MQTSEQRVALVTGANKGIGLEIARQVGKAAHRILLGTRNVTLGEAAVSTLKSAGIHASFIQIDLNKPATLQAAAATITSDYGRLDVLVNNAGTVDRADGPPRVATLDIEQRLSALTCPVMVVAGEQDASASPAAGQLIVNQVAGATLHVVPRSGHFPPLEHPDTFNALLRAFLHQA